MRAGGRGWAVLLARSLMGGEEAEEESVEEVNIDSKKGDIKENVGELQMSQRGWRKFFSNSN